MYSSSTLNPVFLPGLKWWLSDFYFLWDRKIRETWKSSSRKQRHGWEDNTNINYTEMEYGAMEGAWWRQSKLKTKIEFHTQNHYNQRNCTDCGLHQRILKNVSFDFYKNLMTLVFLFFIFKMSSNMVQPLMIAL